MIRNFRVFSVVLCLVALSVATMPILAQADIFNKPNPSNQTQGSSGEGKKKGFFYFLKRDKSKDAEPGKSKSSVYTKPRKSVKMKGSSVFYGAPPVDPILMGMRGRGPETAQELLDVAAAHRAPRIKNMLIARAKNQKMLARKQLEWDRMTGKLAQNSESRATASRSAYKGPEETSPREADEQEPRKTYKKSVNRPTQVFNKNK